MSTRSCPRVQSRRKQRVQSSAGMPLASFSTVIGLRDGLPLLRRPPAARLGRGNMESRLLGPNPLGAMHVGDEGLVRVLQSPQKARLLAITGVDAHPSEPHPPGARPAHDLERMLAL